MSEQQGLPVIPESQWFAERLFQLVDIIQETPEQLTKDEIWEQLAGDVSILMRIAQSKPHIADLMGKDKDFEPAMHTIHATLRNAMFRLNTLVIEGAELLSPIALERFQKIVPIAVMALGEMISNMTELNEPPLPIDASQSPDTASDLLGPRRRLKLVLQGVPSGTSDPRPPAI